MTMPEATDAAPSTVAVVDIGANSVRMEIAELYPDGRTEVMERLQRPVRLGRDAFVDGVLHQDTITAALSVLRDYRRLLDTYRATSVHAVATSAVREASNAEAFLDRVSRTVGLDVDVIESSEQCRLVVSAVRQDLDGAYDLSRHTAVVVEVGGGNTLVSVLRSGQIVASQSYDLGAIRMQEMLATAQEQPARAAELLRHHIGNTVDDIRKTFSLQTIGTFIAVGGDARFAASHLGTPVAEGHLESIPLAKLERFLSQCISASTEELARRFSLPFAHAETLVPALLVYHALLRATRARRVLVSRVSMRDGLLLDLPRHISGKEDPDLTRSILASAATLGAKYQYDAEHAEHVSMLAMRLFDELQREHGLTSWHRTLLQVAALLHDIGSFVNNRVHHKHSCYLISNTDLFGLRRRDMAIIALVARYHRRSVPRSDHLDYMAFPREDRMVINKLAALLRVANALDRGHWQQLRNFALDRQGRDLVLYVHDTTDLILERHTLAGRADLFEDIFGLRLRLDEDTSGRAARLP
jgi:exopolyphosphatase / guanosine-5'-triphosphate,3'-diphosphate pyrophosphatase